jgi:hypothetical protein
MVNLIASKLLKLVMYFQSTALPTQASLRWRGHQDVERFTAIVGCYTVSNAVCGSPNFLKPDWQALKAMKKVVPMAKLAKSFSMLIVLALTAYLPTAKPASAISAELAKKCRTMAIKAYPPPTPGSKSTGAEKSQRDYFRECIAKGDKIEN